MAFSVTRRASEKNDTQAPASLSNIQQLLSAADAARDNRNWPQASKLYAEYLARSDDGPIWVQLGHALKESGNLNGAEDAYRRSLELGPDVADTQLQLGHLYKKMGKFSDAIGAYREAVRLDETLFDARRELVNFGVSTREAFRAQRHGLPRHSSIYRTFFPIYIIIRPFPASSAFNWALQMQ